MELATNYMGLELRNPLDGLSISVRCPRRLTPACLRVVAVGASAARSESLSGAGMSCQGGPYKRR